MVLTTIDETQAPAEARYLLARSRQADQPAGVSRAMMELVTTIMVYKFEQMSRLEVEAMLGLTLQETRVYQEAKAEGREEGERIGEQRGERIGEQRGEQRGRQQEAISLVLKLLTRRLNRELPTEVRSRLEALVLPQLEALTEILLDFTCLEDLLTWLEVNQASEADHASDR